MKQTQINKIEWKEIVLGEIFEFENKTGIKAGEGLEEGKYKFFTSSDNQSKFLDRFNFNGEHLIFSTGGKAGLHYCNEPFSVSNDCFNVKVKSHSTKFVYYLLKSKIYLLERGFKGAGLKHLSKDYLKKIKVKLPFLPNGSPDLKEQERIVNILEENERQIKRVGKAGDLLDEYLKSVFYEMFYRKGFAIKLLGEVCTKITDGTHDTPKRTKEGVLFITGKNIRPFRLDLSEVEYVSKEDHKIIYSRCNPEFNDVMYTNIGANVGTAVRNPFKIEFSMKNVALLKPNKNELLPHYLEHFYLVL